MNIFLDDERIPKDITWVKIPNVEYTICRDQTEFEQCVTENFNELKVISFDHDLGYRFWKPETSGYTCLKWFCEYCIFRSKIPKSIEMYFHSMNPIGKSNMISYWECFKEHFNWV